MRFNVGRVICSSHSPAAALRGPRCSHPQFTDLRTEAGGIQLSGCIIYIVGKYKSRDMVIQMLCVMLIFSICSIISIAIPCVLQQKTYF